MIVFVLAQLLMSAASERVHVVTPENQLAGEVSEVTREGNATVPDGDDTYVQAYREIRNSVAERRNPLSSYGEGEHYNTLSHSSYIDEDVYPEFSHKGQPFKHHRHPSAAYMYGPPAPVSYYHHHHHPEPITHHTVIGYPDAFHYLSSFLAKFGLQKIVKLIAKIAVLKIILKFVAIVALFLVLPSLMPKEKDKEDNDDDRVLKHLNYVTDMVWNSIAENEKMDDDEKEDEEEQDGEEEESEEEDEHKDKDKGDLDETDLKLLNKIIKQWKEENFGGPDKGSAVKILLHCINIANRVLGMMLGYLKMKNDNMDALDTMVMDRFSIYVKEMAKIWPKFTGLWKG